MISIHHLDGYKYVGPRPRAVPGTLNDFRDNLTYLNISFSDWEHDKKMLRFVFKEHVPLLTLSGVEGLLSPYLADNAIPRLHFIIKEHSDESKGMTVLMVIKGEDPATIALQRGEACENVLELIAQKKRFYRDYRLARKRRPG